MLQADSLNRTLSILTKEHMVKSYTIFGDSSHSLNVGLCVSLQYDMLDMRKNQDHKHSKAHLLANEYAENFICFVKLRSWTPRFL